MLIINQLKLNEWKKENHLFIYLLLSMFSLFIFMLSLHFAGFV